MIELDQILLETEVVGPEGHVPLWDDIETTMEIGGVEYTFADHYDRDTNPISLRTWMRLRLWDEAHDHEYKRVGSEVIGEYWVSTVWIGLDHGIRMFDGDTEYEPEIFETRVFKGEQTDLDCRRYSTLREAQEGHERMCEEVRLFC